MEDKERTLTEAEADEPECKSEQKPEPTTEENSEQNAEPESKENSEDESELAIIAEEAPADITKDNCGIVSKDLEFYKDFNDLIELINQSDHIYDMDLINKAYRVALKEHGHQRRSSGIPYIFHPVSVAYILVQLGMDNESVAAALLHDVVEDTPVTLDEIRKEFGNEIAELIDGVTKLGKIPYSSREVQQAENIRKMLMAMAKDIRVIIIKLADRLHNMRTIECMKEQHRRDKALENMEVYAPIAHRLGIRVLSRRKWRIYPYATLTLLAIVKLRTLSLSRKRIESSLFKIRLRCFTSVLTLIFRMFILRVELRAFMEYTVKPL